ncbi:MAG: tRNA 5-methoxyuridine(34)/uridine 5-oxyacetic acid(34) synthase CmoB [Gammaproteobacteria bacterium]|nr:tRNA 5-methoxyuridine(34)/uridine 5-oxyacetic acid(34) synthase CmoB [Gammaproteobacteria bacterium]
MFDAVSLQEGLRDTVLETICNPLLDAVEKAQAWRFHGDYPRWRAALDAAPEVGFSELKSILNADTVAAHFSLDDQSLSALRMSIDGLKPWRKGPFQISDVYIDTEWRSDWKWQRVRQAMSPLEGKSVLDVGCGSGYHLWRMRGDCAQNVIGIEPNLIFNLQFDLIKKYIGDHRVHCLPLTLEQMPANLRCFDTVFSMGVLYHRREPHEHLQQLKDALKDDGELIIETLVIPTDPNLDSELSLDGRYARMRNIWVLPSVARVTRWLHEAGFKQVKFVDLNVTSVDEQRTTAFMPHQSLIDSLDPDNPSITVEGHPRPHRATWTAQK